MRFAWTLLAVLFVAGCGTTEVDPEEGERAISNSVIETTGARVKSVECPGGLEAEKGLTFTCTVTGEDGTEGDVEVEQTDDEGTFSFPKTPFLRVRELEKQITTAIAEQAGFDATVECPEITEFEKGGTFQCDSEAQGTQRPVNVTQKDDKGNVSFELG